MTFSMRPAPAAAVLTIGLACLTIVLSGRERDLSILPEQTPGARQSGAAPTAADIDAQLNRLDARLRQAEAIRAVKRLQHAYAQYVELGLWNDMADLFSTNGVAYISSSAVTGRENIRRQLLQENGGRLGLAEGRLNLHPVMEPVITFDPDGRTVRGRWHVLGMVGQHGESASWVGGVYENEYIEENGVWAIKTLREYPMFTGKYEDNGWVETPDGAPFHYDPARAGRPVPDAAAVSAAPRSSGNASRDARVADLMRRVRQLDDEAAIINLQHAYGYYVDRKMWDDVADLFSTRAAFLEIDNSGVYIGANSIRRGLNRFGPAGLKDGEINDHLQLNTVVTVSADGLGARARGIELRMLGVNGQNAEWGAAVFDNAYVKENGTWKVGMVRVYPRMFADYEKGWKVGKPAPGPSSQFSPDRPSARAYEVYPKVDYPPFGFPHPVTGRAPQYPAGVNVPRTDSNPSYSLYASTDSRPLDARLAEIERRLARALASDGTENVANAYGYYIDGFLWDETADLFARDGWKELSYIGTYVGRERVRQSMKMRYGNRNGRTRGGASFAMHQKTQPVIHVADDGRTARIRTRLFQLGGSTWLTGIYENETTLEDGVWKIAGMDLDYVWTAGYRAGWARVNETDNRRFAPQAPPALAPDRPLRGVTFAPFPKVAEMGFHYANPVSGRAPSLVLK